MLELSDSTEYIAARERQLGLDGEHEWSIPAVSASAGLACRARPARVAVPPNTRKTQYCQNKSHVEGARGRHEGHNRWA